MPKARKPAAPRSLLVLKHQQRFLSAFKLVGTIQGACRAIKMSREQVYHWRHTDPAFSALFDECKLAVIDLLEDSTLHDALGKWDEEELAFVKGDPILKMFLLKALDPKKYRENIKLEHAGSVTLMDLCVDDPDAPKAVPKK